MRKTFQIDSHKRDSGSHSSFTYKLDMHEFGDAKGLVACVSKCQIPRTYYLIRAGMNKITLRETQDINITIPIGNYSTDTFITKMTSLLNAATVNAGVYTIVLDESTGKFTFTSTIAASLIMPENKGSSIHEQFGFNAGTTNALPCTSTNVVKFISEDTVFIRSRELVIDPEGVLQSIIAADTPDFGSITYNCPNEVLNARPLNTTNSNGFRIELTDHDGVPLDTNGLPLFIELVVWQPYENIILRILGEVPKILRRFGLID